MPVNPKHMSSTHVEGVSRRLAERLIYNKRTIRLTANVAITPIVRLMARLQSLGVGGLLVNHGIGILDALTVSP